MLRLEHLLLFASFLVLAHWISRIGLPRRMFSASESFLLGHWPFLFLNLVILFYTGGQDWTDLRTFSPSILWTAGAVVVLGVLGFLFGGLLAVLLQRKVLPFNFAVESSTSLRAGVFITFLGLAASIPNALYLRWVDSDARSTALLAVGQLLVPGVLLCFYAVWDEHLRPLSRALGGVCCLAGAAVLSLNWSRRPILVVVVGAIVLFLVRRRGYFDRRLLVVVMPALLVFGVLGLLWRNVFAFDQQVYDLVDRDLVSYYAERLWLESSAFSALMKIVETNGLLQISGGGSLLLPLVFWIPRAIFPSKPAAYDVGEIVGTPYSIGPSLYGEVLVNLTVLGLVPFMIVFGLVLKWLDLSWGRARLPGPVVALHVILILDLVFLVRGSFHTMFTPILLHCVAPLILFGLDRFASRRFHELRVAIQGSLG